MRRPSAGPWISSPTLPWWSWSWGTARATSWSGICGKRDWRPCSAPWVTRRTSSGCSSPCGPGPGTICSSPWTPASCDPFWSGPWSGSWGGPCRSVRRSRRGWIRCSTRSTGSSPESPTRSS